MEIGTKPIPISVLTAVTNSALNAAFVFPSRRIEISDSHTDLNRSADINIQAIDAALQDFEVSAVRAWHVKVGKLVRRARQPMTDQQFTAVLCIWESWLRLMACSWNVLALYSDSVYACRQAGARNVKRRSD
jgi:hypothetical protein